MDMQRIRTIIIVILTAGSLFILVSPFVASSLGSRTVDFFMEMLGRGSFAVFPAAALTLAAMWGWRAPSELKFILVILHIIFVCAAAFWVWIFWSIWSGDFMAGAV